MRRLRLRVRGSWSYMVCRGRRMASWTSVVEFTGTSARCERRATVILRRPLLAVSDCRMLVLRLRLRGFDVVLAFCGHFLA